jgi:hypothetical protein
MGYRLQMSAEIYDWLTELRDSDPPSAALTAQALAALADGGDRLGPPLVTAVAARLSPDDLDSALDRHYQAQLESMNAMRRQVAHAATLRKRIELAQNVGDDAFQPADPGEAAARLDEITGQIEQELGLQELGPEAPAEDLMELRPGAPADSGIRILFAVEPPGTARPRGGRAHVQRCPVVPGGVQAQLRIVP